MAYLGVDWEDWGQCDVGPLAYRVINGDHGKTETIDICNKNKEGADTSVGSFLVYLMSFQLSYPKDLAHLLCNGNQTENQIGSLRFMSATLHII